MIQGTLQSRRMISDLEESKASRRAWHLRSEPNLLFFALVTQLPGRWRRVRQRGVIRGHQRRTTVHRHVVHVCTCVCNEHACTRGSRGQGEDTVM